MCIIFHHTDCNFHFFFKLDMQKQSTDKTNDKHFVRKKIELGTLEDFLAYQKDKDCLYCENKD